MKFLLLSDCHLLYEKPRARLDDAYKTCLGKMEYVLGYAKKNACIILQAGDLFNVPRAWYLLADYIRLFQNYDVPIYAVYGQHDQYFRSRAATMMDILSSGIITLLASQPVEFSGVDVYGCGYGEEIPEVINQKKLNILVIHRMIVEKKLWLGQEDYTYASSFLSKYKRFDLILCGDAHQKFLVKDREGRIICNTGCMIRKSVDLYHHDPGFFVYDTEQAAIQWIKIPHKPAEEVLSRKHIEDEKQINEMLEIFIQAVSSKEVEVGASFEDNLEMFIKENKVEEDVVNIISGVMEREGR